MIATSLSASNSLSEAQRSRTACLPSGYDIPLVGLGTWKSEPGLVEAAVKAALQSGYRHIDCAAVYMNEDEVGKALEDSFKSASVSREDVFITSKLWSGHVEVSTDTRENVSRASASFERTISGAGPL